jgi:phenylpropionate dioxygenase-like ring-hydroxylating dioxygenase large terminal subunit
MTHSATTLTTAHPAPAATAAQAVQAEPAEAAHPAVGPGWWNRWYPVAYLRDLETRLPTAFTLLGEDLVLWWDRPAGTWRAFADVCPHRLVPLSEGRINEAGELECPYHGWTFAGDGRCTAIPQAPPDTANSGNGVGEAADTAPARLASPRSRCRAYATAGAQGLLFVFAGEPAAAAAVPLPLVPVLEEEQAGWVVQDTFRDLPYDALTLLENVLDVSHVPFTHHATVGRRENAGPVQAELTEFGPGGFSGVWAEGPRRGRLGSQFTTFAAPCLMWHDLTAKGFARILTVVYATPTRRGECRLFARFPFRFESPWPGRLLRLRPEWLQHLGNHIVLEDDQIFLHRQERVLAARGGSGNLARSCYLATGADRYVQALHDWVKDLGGEPFPGVPLPPRLADGPLLERWESHGRHCRSCRTADRRLGWLEPLGWGLAGLAAIAAAWWGPSVGGALLLALAVGGAVVAVQCRRWRRALRVGRRLPPRNR